MASADAVDEGVSHSISISNASDIYAQPVSFHHLAEVLPCDRRHQSTCYFSCHFDESEPGLSLALGEALGAGVSRLISNGSGNDV